MKQENYQDVLSQFKVEELKERLEFDMAGCGWQYETKPTAKLNAKNDKIVGGEGGAKINFQWKQ